MNDDFFEEKIVPCYPIIVKICRAYTNTQEDFEDYYQEVCLQIWRSKNNFKNKSEWSTWIYKISLNVCLTLSKKNKSMRHQSMSEAANFEAAQEEPVYSDKALNALNGAIRNLSSIDRAIILLYLEQKTYKEIAEIMSTNANNIGVRVKRIKKRLKDLITLNKTDHERVN